MLCNCSKIVDFHSVFKINSVHNFCTFHHCDLLSCFRAWCLRYHQFQLKLTLQFNLFHYYSFDFLFRLNKLFVLCVKSFCELSIMCLNFLLRLRILHCNSCRHSVCFLRNIEMIYCTQSPFLHYLLIRLGCQTNIFSVVWPVLFLKRFESELHELLFLWFELFLSI